MRSATCPKCKLVVLETAAKCPSCGKRLVRRAAAREDALRRERSVGRRSEDAPVHREMREPPKTPEAIESKDTYVNQYGELEGDRSVRTPLPGAPEPGDYPEPAPEDFEFEDKAPKKPKKWWQSSWFWWLVILGGIRLMKWLVD